MPSALSRRSVLLTGAAGAGLTVLSGCGLRLDVPPEVPALDASEQLRNRIARIFAATTVADGDPETAGEDLAKLRDAIGPEWAPPSELATRSPSAEPGRSFVEAAGTVAAEVFDAAGGLGSGLIPVLVDVATGCALTAGTVDPAIPADADRRLKQALSGTAEASASPQSTARSTDWNTILDQARAASYGYERLAVRFERGSTERDSAVARLESLGSLAGEMLERLGEEDAAPDAPAWRLDPSPTDAASAAQLALGLEDAIAASLLPWLQTDPQAALRLWESARMRAVFAAPQPLRFTYRDGTAAAAEAGQ